MYSICNTADLLSTIRTFPKNGKVITLDVMGDTLTIFGGKDRGARTEKITVTDAVTGDITVDMSLLLKALGAIKTATVTLETKQGSDVRGRQVIATPALFLNSQGQEKPLQIFATYRPHHHVFLKERSIVTVAAAALHKMLKTAVDFSEKGSSLDNFKIVRMTIKDHRLIISGSTRESIAVSDMPCDAEDMPEIFLYEKMVRDDLSRFPKTGTVELSRTDLVLTVKQKGLKLLWPLERDKYIRPQQEEQITFLQADWNDICTLPAKEVKQGIRIAAIGNNTITCTIDTDNCIFTSSTEEEFPEDISTFSHALCVEAHKPIQFEWQVKHWQAVLRAFDTVPMQLQSSVKEDKPIALFSYTSPAYNVSIVSMI